MAISYFPVESGLVQSLGRPGETSRASLRMLARKVPNVCRFFVKRRPSSLGSPSFRNRDLATREHLLRRLEGAARSLGVVVVPLEIQGAEDVQRVFGEIERAKVDGLMVLGGSVPLANRDRIISMSAKAKLPAIWVDRQIVQDGALLSYGADRVDLFRRAAGYVDRILKGAKPADLPIEQPTKYVLAINLKTAKALGITIPQTLLLLADHVVE